MVFCCLAMLLVCNHMCQVCPRDLNFMKAVLMMQDPVFLLYRECLSLFSTIFFRILPHTKVIVIGFS